MLRTVMEFNDLRRELKRLLDDGTTEPNPQLLAWVSDAEKHLSTVKAKFDGKDGKENGQVISDPDEGEGDNKNRNAVGDVKILVDLQREKRKLLTELSEWAGHSLTNNNPAIANLSDANRPSKIGEKFSEMYDNDWTDAMETLDGNGFDERSSIELLLDVLTSINEECVKKKEERLNMLVSFALQINLKDHKDSDVYQNVGPAQPTELRVNAVAIEEECSKYLSTKDMTYPHDKKAQDELHKILHKKFKDTKRQNILKNKSLIQYVNKGFELCWAMCSQCPPVLMVVDQNKTDLYRSYTRTGDVVDYVVWPSLLLDQSGAVLYKGVAQMSSNSDGTRIYENQQL